MKDKMIEIQKKSMCLNQKTVELITEILEYPERFRDIILIANRAEYSGIVRGSYCTDQIHYDAEKLIGMIEFTKFCLLSNQVDFS